MRYQILRAASADDASGDRDSYASIWPIASHYYWLPLYRRPYDDLLTRLFRLQRLGLPPIYRLQCHHSEKNDAVGEGGRQRPGGNASGGQRMSCVGR